MEFVTRTKKINKRLRVDIESAPHEIRSSMRALRTYRLYLKYRYEEFAGLTTFKPILAAFIELDRHLAECADFFRRAATEELSMEMLWQYMSDEGGGASGISDIFSEYSGSLEHYNIDSDEVAAINADAAELMNRVWREAAHFSEALAEALVSADDNPNIANPMWRR